MPTGPPPELDVSPTGVRRYGGADDLKASKLQGNTIGDFYVKTVQPAAPPWVELFANTGIDLTNVKAMGWRVVAQLSVCATGDGSSPRMLCHTLSPKTDDLGISGSSAITVS